MVEDNSLVHVISFCFEMGNLNKVCQFKQILVIVSYLIILNVTSLKKKLVLLEFLPSRNIFPRTLEKVHIYNSKKKEK